MFHFPQILRHIFVILIVTTILIPISIFYSRNKPFSKVFHHFNSKDYLKELAKKLNNERVFKAQAYLSTLNTTKSQPFSPNPELVIVIVTVKRKAYDATKLGYILQTMAATHKLYMEDTEFRKKMLLICNVDIHPRNYSEVEAVKSYIPVIERYGSSSVPIQINRSRETLYSNKVYHSKYDKETVDYMYCLEASYSLGAKYILLLEDDVLPMKNTLGVLKTKIQYLASKADDQTSYTYIKLYYPQRWQGYSYDSVRIIEIISIGCVGAGVAVMVHFIMCAHTPYFVQLTYFLCGIWVSIVAAMIIGRQNMYEFYRISKYLYTLKPSPGCCTQAMMFTRQFIPAIIEFLSAKHKNLHTDLAIYNFTNTTGLPAYQIEPNLFYHVGMYTSLSSERKNAEEFIFQAF